MRYFKKISGERIYLSPVNIDDAPVFTKWMNDEAVSGNLEQYSQNFSVEAEQEFLKQLSSGGHDYAIVLREGNVLLGLISINRINKISRKASIGMFIGEADQRGKGYGSEALRLILDYGFSTLNLHNIMLTVHADNEQAIACYKKAGFREFGRRKEACFKRGRYFDTVYMEILPGDFYKK